MKKINPILVKKIKLFLFPVTTIIVIVILTIKFLLPQIGEVGKTVAKTNESKSELSLLETKARKLIELKNSSLTNDFKKMEFLLPSDKNIPLILSSLSYLEKQNNVLFEGMNLKPGVLDKEKGSSDSKTKAGVSESINFTFSFIGPEDSSLEFIEQLLKVVPIFNINRLTLSGGDGMIRTTVDLSTFYLKLPETIGKLETPLPELSSTQKNAFELTQSFTVSLEIPEEVIEGSSPSAKPLTRGIFEL